MFAGDEAPRVFRAAGDTGVRDQGAAARLHQGLRLLRRPRSVSSFKHKYYFEISWRFEKQLLVILTIQLRHYHAQGTAHFPTTPNKTNLQVILKQVGFFAEKGKIQSYQIEEVCTEDEKDMLCHGNTW